MANPCKKILTDEGFSSDDATEILARLRNKDTFENTAKNIAEELDLKAKRELSDNLSKDKTDQFVNTLKDIASTLKNPYKRIWDILVNGKTSIANIARTRFKKRFNEIMLQSGMRGLDFSILTYTKGKFHDNFITELFDFNGTPKTKDKLAFNLAEAVHAHQTAQVKEANLHGAGMGQIDDYVTKLWHDSVKIKNAGADKWVNDILKELDIERTIARIFESRKGLSKLDDFDIKTYLHSAYESMSHSTSEGGLLLDVMQLKRIFAFKDAESLMRYNQTYGHKNLASAVFNNMEMMDNHIALAEVMGYGYEIDIKEGVREIVSPVVETKKTLLALRDMEKITDAQYSRLSAALREISGDNYVIGNPTLAKFHSAYVGFRIMTSLGKAMISSILDISSAGIFLHYQGINPMKGYYGLMRHTFRSMTRQISKEEKRNVFQMLKVGLDGAIMSHYNRYTTGDMVSGKISEGANMMFHLNFLNLWTNMMREGFSSMSSMHFANNLHKSFDDIPELMRKNLEDYGFTSKDWAELQNIGSFNASKYNPKAGKNENYITSDWILENGGSQKLADKLDHYYINESRYAVPEADASDRVIMFGNHDRGTVPDIARRLFFFLRTHQVNQARNLYPRMFAMGMPSIVHTIPAIGLGYASIALKNLAGGKEPPDHNNPNLIVDALIQSGYAPIIGDFIAGEYGRYQHEFDEAILGAGYSDIKSWGELFTGLYTGNKNAPDLFNKLRYNVPYANLFYTEAVLNYNVHYGLMESVSPGYLDRIAARAKGMGQDFIYSPTNIRDRVY